jgi:hypothetical protein
MTHAVVFRQRRFTMARPTFLTEHRTWEDLLSMALGAVTVLTAWMVGDGGNQLAAINSAVAGILVLALGGAELVALRRWEEGLEIACGFWLIASPFIFGYAGLGTLRYWNFVLGTAVALLAALELRQDWKLNPEELAKQTQ